MTQRIATWSIFAGWDALNHTPSCKWMVFLPWLPEIIAHIRKTTPKTERKRQRDKLHISTGMHTSKPAHSSTSVLSHISPGIPAPSLGARNDLGLFLLINAYLGCSKMRGCRGGNMRHLKLRRQVALVILHAAPRSSLALCRQINLFFYGNSVIERRR